MIKTFVAEGFIKAQLNKIFNNKITCAAFEENLWIAGGFAREVCHAHFNLNSKDEIFKRKRVINYLTKSSSSGDIDFFCNSESVCNNVIKNISEYINSLDSFNSINHYFTNFSWNYKTCRSNPFLGTLVMSDVKIQIVNKFFFNSIKDCFDSFDVVNCRYAIEKVNNDYIIHYDNDALQCDKEKILKLDSAKSPFTISRIVKYLRHRNLKRLSKDKKTQQVFLECLYKVIENKWPKMYNIHEDIMKNSVKNLHKTVRLDPEALSMFIGFIKETIVEEQNVSFMSPANSGYGIYYSNVYKDIDWASNQLINACKL